MELIAAASALALAIHSAPAAAQSMPGMTMPMPEKKAAPKKKPGKKTAAKKAAPKRAPAKKAVTRTAPMKGMSMPMEHGEMPANPQAAPQSGQPMTMPMDHSKMD